jgi:hypothetical protein
LSRAGSKGNIEAADTACHAPAQSAPETAKAADWPPFELRIDVSGFCKGIDNNKIARNVPSTPSKKMPGDLKETGYFRACPPGFYATQSSHRKFGVVLMLAVRARSTLIPSALSSLTAALPIILSSLQAVTKNSVAMTNR